MTPCINKASILFNSILKISLMNNFYDLPITLEDFKTRVLNKACTVRSNKLRAVSEQH